MTSFARGLNTIWLGLQRGYDVLCMRLYDILYIFSNLIEHDVFRHLDMDDIERLLHKRDGLQWTEQRWSLELTEGRSTGIPKILRSLKENNSPPPEFKTDEDRTYFYIKFKVNPEVKSEDIKGPMSEDNQYRILSSLKKGPLSRKEIMERLEGLGYLGWRFLLSA